MKSGRAAFEFGDRDDSAIRRCKYSAFDCAYASAKPSDVARHERKCRFNPASAAAFTCALPWIEQDEGDGRQHQCQFFGGIRGFSSSAMALHTALHQRHNDGERVFACAKCHGLYKSASTRAHHRCRGAIKQTIAHTNTNTVTAAPLLTVTAPSALCDLPADLLETILTALTPHDWTALGRCTRALERLIDFDAKSLWRSAVNTRWRIVCAHDHAWRRVYWKRVRSARGARYQCNVCSCTKTYASRHALSLHVEAHRTKSATAQRQLHVCRWADCHRHFNTASALQNHCFTHTGAKRRHVCHECAQAVTAQNDSDNGADADTDAKSLLCRDYIARLAMRQVSTADGEADVVAISARAQSFADANGCAQRFSKREQLLAHLQTSHGIG